MVGHLFSKFLRNSSILKNRRFPLSKRIMKMFVTTPSKSKPLLNKAGIIKTHSPLTLNAMKFSPVISLKKLKHFANKRQVKHISSCLESSIPFHSLVNMVDSEDITVEKIKTQELSLEIINLSNTFQKNTNIQDSPPEPLQIQAVDPNNKSKPQYKNYCSFCRKNNHSVSTCFRRLKMPKESKPPSRSPTPSFYQHFKTPSNKPQYSRYRKKSNSNSYRRTSRDTRYKSRSYSRSHSRPRYNDKSHPHN